MAHNYKLFPLLCFFLQSNNRVGENLKEELENVNVQLEGLRKKKAERMNRFKEVIDQLLKLSFQLGISTDYLKKFAAEETDLSLQKLEELRRQLVELQNEKVGFTFLCQYPNSPNETDLKIWDLQDSLHLFSL